mgnify:CR=1 FL=1
METRYRTETDTWTDADGNTHTDTYQVPYDYYICTVTLENFNLSHVPVYIMSEEQFGMYATYMATLGNRPDLFPGSGYIGKYVEAAIPTTTFPRRRWTMRCLPPSSRKRKSISATPMFGRQQPSTSFDCSGFVSWSSIIPVGMWAGWARRDFAISVRPYPLPTSSRAIWCFSPEPMIPPASAMWYLCRQQYDDPLRRSDLLCKPKFKLLAVPFLPLWALAVKESERYEPENYEAPWRAGEEQRQNL